MICWFSERHTLTPGAQATPSSTRRDWARAIVKDLQYRLDINTLHRDETRDLAGAQRDRPRHAAHHAAAVLRRVPPQPRAPASFILVDEATNDTVAAGMIV